MQHGFDMYRVYLSAPGDLQKELDVCRAAISDVNRDVAMPEKILLVSVGLTNDDQITGHRAVVAENIRQCTYFIQIFEDDWGPKNLFRKMFQLALDCRDDAAFPMREAIVCLKAAPRETDPERLELRTELEQAPHARVLHFDTAESMYAQLMEVCAGWVRSIMESAPPADAASAG